MGGFGRMMRGEEGLGLWDLKILGGGKGGKGCGIGVRGMGGGG